MGECDPGTQGFAQSRDRDHAVPDMSWPGAVPYGVCLSPFQSSTPLLEPGLEA